MKKTVYIYALVDPITDEIRYIGKTKYPKQRYCSHMLTNDVNKHKNHWILSLKKIDAKPTMKILEKVDDKSWGAAEEKWIAEGIKKGWPLTNIQKGGVYYPTASSYLYTTHVPKNLVEPYVRPQNMDALNRIDEDSLDRIIKDAFAVAVEFMSGVFSGRRSSKEADTVIETHVNNALRLHAV